MKFIMVFACIIASTVAQRGSYAGSGPKGVPQLHPRFRDTNEDSSPSGTPTLGDRLGNFNGNRPNMPVDAKGDTNLVDRLKEWPRENQPFWLTNHEIIEKNRGGKGGSSISNSGSSLNGGFNTGSSQNGGADPNSVFTRPSRVNQQSFGHGPDSMIMNSQNGGTSRPVATRFGGNDNIQGDSNNSFSVIMNGQWRSYVYNAMSDSWVRRY